MLGLELTSGDVGVGERTGEALGDVWLARGAPLAFASCNGVLLCGGDTLPLCCCLPPVPFTIGGGGVFGFRGRLWGVEGTFVLDVVGLVP